MKPKIRKVALSEHIKKIKGEKPGTKTESNGGTQKRGRGRPRKTESDSLKNVGVSGSVERIAEGISPQPTTPHSPTVFADNPTGQQNQGAQTIEVIPDTTEEAKQFLRMPFDLAAFFTKVEEAALTEAELNAAAPSFKDVYDKWILPNLGEHPELKRFAMVMIPIILSKVQVVLKVLEVRKLEALARIKEAEARMHGERMAA